jgi:hypothetical protein
MVSAWRADTKDTLLADTINIFCSSETTAELRSAILHIQYFDLGQRLHAHKQKTTRTKGKCEDLWCMHELVPGVSRCVIVHARGRGDQDRRPDSQRQSQRI